MSVGGKVEERIEKERKEKKRKEKKEKIPAVRGRERLLRHFSPAHCFFNNLGEEGRAREKRFSTVFEAILGV